MTIPKVLLKKLYTQGSLKNTDAGAQFALKNRLSDAELVGLESVAIDGRPAAIRHVRLETGEPRVVTAGEVSSAHPLPFPLGSMVTVQTDGLEIPEGRHEIEIAFETRPFGTLRFKVQDAMGGGHDRGPRIARSERDDYAPEIVRQRQAFVEESSGVKLRHLSQYSFDPHLAKGNCENFTGVAQVPVGFAGPLRVNGEHAQGDFLIPLATSEGTLVASYNRGMKALNASGGVKVTVVDDAMQRAPVFVFQDARAGRDFAAWVESSLEPIRRQAEATSSIARLVSIDPYLSNKFVFLRFNFHTGDAAGQNMVGRATFAACNWILEHYAGVADFYLESNFATDKKGSQVNILRTRGKRVTAEATSTREQLLRSFGVEPRQLLHHYGVANVGAFMAGANSNGLQSANGIAAMFIATGQDAANVAESSAGILYCELTPDGGLYGSLTIPSLIVATHGGGTGLATQRECLEVLGCYGQGKVNKLAEIVAGVALAGEISLAAAIASSDWVASHEKYGRNR
jgi:hydroxymethylglutaryl-CoA reductase (NADPH)